MYLLTYYFIVSNNDNIQYVNNYILTYHYAIARSGLTTANIEYIKTGLS